tara:strand:- start:988 stop:1275 length:288 start_codon:yes stop_codon:yes gene_type:complete
MVNLLLFLNFLGTGEFLLIALVGILLFGPEKIPSLVRSIAKTIRKVKDAGDDIKKEIHATTKENPSFEEVNKKVKEIEDLTNSVKRDFTKNINVK